MLLLVNINNMIAFYLSC